MNLETRRLQDAAVAAAGDRELEPHPGGLPGRVADAHDEGRAALAEGDLDSAIGSDMLATALAEMALEESQADFG
jgi:hypothetical protein